MLGFLSWRAASSEQQLRAVERERADAVAERLLQRAPGSTAAFAAVPAAQRAVRRADGTFELGDVAWLDVAESPLDRDFVVEDRLARAALDEAGAAGTAGAIAEFTALLAASLPPAQRLDVLLAANWFSARHPELAKHAELAPQLPAADDEIERLLLALQPADLARPARALALASALRLAATRGAATSPPAFADRLAPWLPPEVLASLPDRARWQAQHAQLVQRRGTLRELRGAWQRVEAATADATAKDLPATGAVANPFALPLLVAADAHHVLWTQSRASGGHELALLTPAEFVAAIEQAGRDTALPELPPPFVFDVAATTDDAPLGVPGLRAVVDPTARELESVWLRPLLLAGLALGLGVAIAVAVRLQLRAAQREVALARTQSEFLTTVTHELKTPLAGIRLLGEMLAEGRARGREQDYYRMLAGEAERLSQLIQNVLDLGRIERGERAYDLRSHDVGELVATTLAWFVPLVRQDGLVVASTVSGLCRTRIDRDAFVQALVAVLDNARKYGASGGRLDVAVVGGPRAGGDNAVRVAVRDHGPGVPESEHESVFAKFVRGQAHRHGSTPGVGIGLYLARTIVRRLGGELAVASASETAELFPVASGGAAAGNAAIAAAASQGDDASMRTDDAPGTARPAVAGSGPGACFVFRLPVETSA